MKICADAVMISGAFELVVAIVAIAFRDSAERFDILAESSEARMVFIADDFAEVFGIDDDVSDEAVFAGNRVKIKDVDAVDFVSFCCLEVCAEELV